MYEPTTKKSFQDPALADAWLGCALYGGTSFTPLTI